MYLSTDTHVSLKQDDREPWFPWELW